ncbi:G-type lectin S-receptor-like serine/threonine-protein kinase At1g11410 isoform X1 [Cornus florida]|uniref:G-type lectin S-receptor-like serine/threonine-protein kinase At1g11410 isoform X1 n=1 Tax=Cornus florida TaxID=4283 RepID=UPI0028994D04|nr:G-type lectin S-receptor-like serine/threonine-protein kinase At1g11410 isoform X1 [Cornus florida]
MRSETSFGAVMLVLLLLFGCSNTTDTLTRNRFISDAKDEVLVSSNGNFRLGFFSPGKSPNRYIGIWFNKISVFTIVWVANRNNPIKNKTGVFKIADDGNIAIFDTDNEGGLALWSTNVSAISNSTAQLLPSGNLVLIATNGLDHSSTVVWQSFDHPTGTLLPGMKLGFDRRRGLNRFLTCWRSGDDPAPGNYSLKVDLRGSPQFFLYKNSAPIWRDGPWNGRTLNGIPPSSSRLNWSFIDNQDEVYYSISVADTSTFERLVLFPVGAILRAIWQPHAKEWAYFVGSQDRCDEYSRCGASAICNSNNTEDCTCLPGFEPQAPQDLFKKCVEKEKSHAYTCGKGGGEGFIKLTGVKIPDARISHLYKNVSLQECERECFNQCNCTGYASADVNAGGRGCYAWYGELNDIKQYNFNEDGQDFYVRVDAVELAANMRKNSNGFHGMKRTLVIIFLPVALGLLLFISCSYFFWRKNAKRKGLKQKQKNREMLLLDSPTNLTNKNSPNPNNHEQSGMVELTFYDLDTIAAATDNFSLSRKLGEGGFGPVYKGQLSNGQDIAVKRLSRNSGQGVVEFKNELLLIAKLQHRNLVRVLGCCIENEETMLIYEYMPNKSLDYFIFDETRKSFLDWKRRREIIDGIARGILYLHQDSRLRIIHRDLKASNILLDNELNPKISDFGTARIFGGNQSEAKTKRVMGTYGYMSPEYALDGLFSVKSDVFSFGVIVLELISSKKNFGFFHEDPYSNLIRYVWKLWSEGRAIEIIDPSLGDSCPTCEILRCIQVGLLCVQDSAIDRPTMSSVIFMLSNETNLSSPKQPVFTIPRSQNRKSPETGSSSINEVTVTMLSGR